MDPDLSKPCTKAEALQALAEMGSHVIVSGEWANWVGAPFGVKFQERQFKHDRNNPKGPLADCVGVDIHWIAESINGKVGGRQNDFFGRGSQFRANLQSIREVLTATGEIAPEQH